MFAACVPKNYFMQIIELTKSFLWEPFFPAHEDDTLFHVLLLFTKHHKLNVIPVIESSNSSIVGFITQVIDQSQNSCSLLRRRKLVIKVQDSCRTFAVEEFIKDRDAASDQSRNRCTETEAPPAGLLRMKDARFPRLSNPATVRKSDSLKKTMEIMAASMRESGFLVGDAGRLEGMVTLRDVILPFAPPSMDSRVDGGGFFTSLLNQVGCHVNDGVMIRNR
ncbi:hypothetical protein BHE74_00020423 [Ensete ventricosum]|uniref:Uncharacterized protein n=1 Tax=Ensete ventricosum TaxID=4639 RepID=A0A426YYH8_ENSVE|nr:hypothetical protein B296_00026986 [Ensete ventricosum]RWW26802.1 hypothetical protein GW17_00008797 [Ensete ventricosum]RWW71818.1 hypothetical protein BHE74_00020423 [Ensete ventricosum]